MQFHHGAETVYICRHIIQGSNLAYSYYAIPTMCMSRVYVGVEPRIPSPGMIQPHYLAGKNVGPHPGHELDTPHRDVSQLLGEALACRTFRCQLKCLLCQPPEMFLYL